jgi:hypothetical protein
VLLRSDVFEQAYEFVGAPHHGEDARHALEFGMVRIPALCVATARRAPIVRAAN